MSLAEIMILAAALSMDAFSAALASGLSSKCAHFFSALKMAFFFGLFQFLMPLAGNGVSLFFVGCVGRYGDLVVCLILIFLGIRMILESIHSEDAPKNAFSLSSIIPLAFATSVDALAAGVTLGTAQVPIIFSSAIIGITAFAFSIIGVMIGIRTNCLGLKKAGVIGGTLLIILGIRAALSFLCA